MCTSSFYRLCLNSYWTGALFLLLILRGFLLSGDFQICFRVLSKIQRQWPCLYMIIPGSVMALYVCQCLPVTPVFLPLLSRSALLFFFLIFLILFWPPKEKKHGSRYSGRDILLLHGMGKCWTPRRRKRKGDTQLQVRCGRWRNRTGVEIVIHGWFPKPPPVFCFITV